MERKLNVKLSPYDERDFKAKDILVKSSHPEEYISEYRTEIYDQGSSEMCLAFTTATIKEMQEWKEYGHKVRMSPGFIYANRGDGYQGEGMYPREALKLLRSHGTVDFDTFPYVDTVIALKERFSKLDEYTIRNAFQNRINTYAKTSDEDEIKDAIMQHGAVMIAIMVYDSFMRTHEKSIVKNVEEGEKLIGGHAMVVIGWEKIDSKEYWIVQNSWGKAWGYGGLCYIPFDYNVGKEFWIMTDKERTSVDYISVKIDDNKLYIVNMDGSSSVYEMDTKVIIDENDRTLIPARFPFEALGHTVEWIEHMRMVKIWK